MDDTQQGFVKTQKKKSMRRARRRFLTVVTAFVLVLLFVVIMVDQFFVVREVHILSESPFYSVQEIEEATGLSHGRNMFSFTEESVRAEMLRRLSYFSDVRVTKRFPSSVEISFEEIPGTMYVDVAEGHYILAPDFFVIAKVSEEELAAKPRTHVLCNTVYRCVVGEKICMEDTQQLALLEEIFAVLAQENTVEQVEYLDAQNRFHITLNYAGKWDIDLGDSAELDFKVKMFLRAIEQTQKDYGPEVGGRIDVTGVTEAITKLYTSADAIS